ncbi:hypothetical protein ORJ04_14035 [Rheinheimera baltica]|uniref:DUF3618 domain-containing protein n=1 Tax=Rheinheimera baltica TaxID=67576 RepID=A0ABT9I201_9GAMM|nr:hypothetical protein [Rheinheimera baltica]MDP5137070.1 hypothetical protein [Rheinheimera baltica]
MSNLNLRIDQLQQQLPQQREQLMAQTALVNAALRARLTLPTVLVLATLSGAFIGLWLRKHDGSEADIAQHSTGHTPYTSVLWQSVFQHSIRELWRSLLS